MTFSFVTVSSRSRNPSVTFGVLSDTLPFSLTTFCTASWKALPLVAELLKASKTLPPVVFLTLWIVWFDVLLQVFYDLCERHICPWPNYDGTNRRIFLSGMGNRNSWISLLFLSCFLFLFCPLLFFWTYLDEVVCCSRYSRGSLFWLFSSLRYRFFQLSLRFFLISGVPSSFEVDSLFLENNVLHKLSLGPIASFISLLPVFFSCRNHLLVGDSVSFTMISSWSLSMCLIQFFHIFYAILDNHVDVFLLFERCRHFR